MTQACGHPMTVRDPPSFAGKRTFPAAPAFLSYELSTIYAVARGSQRQAAMAEAVSVYPMMVSEVELKVVWEVL
jgi:hypothetical protein